MTAPTNLHTPDYYSIASGTQIICTSDYLPARALHLYCQVAPNSEDKMMAALLLGKPTATAWDFEVGVQVHGF